jgi:hypothetical protein
MAPPTKAVTFLSSPKELRQQILVSGLDTDYTVTLPILPFILTEQSCYYDEFDTKYYKLSNIQYAWLDELRTFKDSVKILMKVDRDIVEDVRYVTHKRLNELIRMLKNAVKVHGLDIDDLKQSRENCYEKAALVMQDIRETIGEALQLKE